ncbi:class I SAM-dependent methyltransferase [Pseudoalteromonas luteoviolacea]|uniref:class I SAM-dependent methyltransferase n=1 Tax=Pseudoalteromonas luteoviolacea TaxID=43657 RepID=UPI001B367934|nr:class I SAM-dependent methyltransferase [Pseudoalteromonas luteoviolacea]MBQ4839447.1 class I SAM-dependent methyltransferase [Pseudoalteromonas luteoviolacea]
MQNPQMLQCGLCESELLEHYHQDKFRNYWQCQQCKLVSVAACDRLSPQEEKAIYDSHENDLDDTGYRRFLSRVFEPVHSRLQGHKQGLDFGCGPGPLLAKMFEEVGHSVALYDLYYADNPEVLQRQYDFITCTEVIEHIGQPKSVLTQLLAMLKPGAPLALMTKLVIDPKRFASWHYKNDQTHISFFSRETFEYIAKQFGTKLEFIGNDVIILSKQEVVKVDGREA